MRKSSFFLFLLLFLSFTTDNTTTVWKKNTVGSGISADSLGKIYQIQGRSIVKYDKNGVKTCDYTNLNNGNVFSIDTKNALQTVAFYKDQQVIVLLDNMLGETNTLSLGDYFEWIDLVCFANRDNAFWMYSINNQSLIKTDKNLNIVNQYKNIAQFIGVDINPTQLFEKNEKIFLFDPEVGVLIFDIFGNFNKKIAIKNTSKIQLQEETIYELVGSAIKTYNLQTFDDLTLYKSKDSIVDFDVVNSTIYLQTSKTITKLKVN